MAESKWQEFKKKLAEQENAKPWHLLDSNLRTEQSVAQTRLSICAMCDRYISGTTQCKECGCVMLMKTKLAKAKCPLGKW